METEIYLGHHCSIELERSTICGFIYHIVTYGTHPCCYIEIPEGHRYFGVSYDDINDIECHGGLTYSDSNNWFETKHGWTIGWDYAHANDWYGVKLSNGKINRHPYDKAWTIDELREEVRAVIEQLKADIS